MLICDTNCMLALSPEGAPGPAAEAGGGWLNEKIEEKQKQLLEGLYPPIAAPFSPGV